MINIDKIFVKKTNRFLTKTNGYSNLASFINYLERTYPMRSKVLLLTILSFLVSFNSYAGKITGVVKYDGEAPKFKEIKMEADSICLSHHKEPVFPQTLVLGEGNTMANVFVHVLSGFPKKAYPAPAQEVIVDQLGCMYAPHVMGIMVGQTMKILNPD